jgi:hypothetical protein
LETAVRHLERERCGQRLQHGGSKHAAPLAEDNSEIGASTESGK